jgi:hypothetical protein
LFIYLFLNIFYFILFNVWIYLFNNIYFFNFIYSCIFCSVRFWLIQSRSDTLAIAMDRIAEIFRERATGTRTTGASVQRIEYD